jgi:hypothetical protein
MDFWESVGIAVIIEVVYHGGEKYRAPPPKIFYRTLGSKKFKISIEETQSEEWYQ